MEQETKLPRKSKSLRNSPSLTSNQEYPRYHIPATHQRLTIREKNGDVLNATTAASFAMEATTATMIKPHCIHYW
jgi:hypothetical protein